jgi:hypothetical protein
VTAIQPETVKILTPETEESVSGFVLDNTFFHPHGKTVVLQPRAALNVTFKASGKDAVRKVSIERF